MTLTWKHWMTGVLVLSISSSLTQAQAPSGAIADANVQPTGFYAQLSDQGNTWPPTLTRPGEKIVDEGCLDGSTAFIGDLGGGGCLGGGCLGGGCLGGGCLGGGCLDGGCLDGGCADGGCTDGGCDSIGGTCTGSCDSGCTRCCGPWRHCVSVYGGLLYLRPRNADVAYAVPTNGPIVGPPANNPIEIGRVGVVDPDFDTSFFAGMSYALSACSSLDLRFTSFESTTSDSTGIDPPNVVRSLVSHPSALSADNDSLWAHASQDIDFDLIDLSLRRLRNSCGLTGVNTLIGLRYAHLQQNFLSYHVDNEVENVATDLDFEGLGVRFGLEATRYSCRRQLHGYLRGYTSFVAGEFDGTYLQGRDVDNVIVRADWESGRIVPILDLEVGAGWTHPCGRIRCNLGYTFSAWFNTVMTEDYIKSVQSSNFTDLGDAMTFDGLTADIEWRF